MEEEATAAGVAMGFADGVAAIIEAIPASLRYAITCGIGLFITFIGLKNAGFIVGSDATLVTLGSFGPGLLTFFIGLMATAVMVILRMNGALILGIALTTLASGVIA